MINIIAAMSQNHVIGKDGEIPWSIPRDLQFFRDMTHKKAVIMGRKTWDSLPFDSGLPGRRNIVLTNNKDWAEAEVLSIEQVLELDEDVWVIGGGEIYEQFLPYAKEVHRSIINKLTLCDTFAPTLSKIYATCLNECNVKTTYF
jgi:dihydrofolate reductase